MVSQGYQKLFRELKGAGKLSMNLKKGEKKQTQNYKISIETRVGNFQTDFVSQSILYRGLGLKLCIGYPCLLDTYVVWLNECLQLMDGLRISYGEIMGNSSKKG